MHKTIFFFSISCLIFLFSCKEMDKSLSAATATYKDSVFTDYFRRTSGVVAADAAVSVSLNNGKSLWLFGDSYIDNYDPVTKTVPCLFQVRNAGMLMDINNPGGAVTTLLGTGSPQSYVVKGNDNTYLFWPGTGYQQGDTAFVFLSRIHTTGVQGSFGFESIDSQYVAKIKVPEMTVANIANFGSKKKIIFGNGAEKDAGYWYVYGIRDNSLGRDLFVARYPENNIYANWEYKSASGWSTDINAASKIHSEFTSSFHIVKVKGKYLLITTQFSVGCDQGKEIYSYTSDNPYGPFGNKKTIWTLNDTLQGHFPFFYLAYAHPEYDNAKNELLITYCINSYGICVNTCINNRLNPDYYRPKAIRVPFAAMGL